MPFSQVELALVQGVTEVSLGQYTRDAWQSMSGSLVSVPVGTWDFRARDPANPLVFSADSVVVSGLFPQA